MRFFTTLFLAVAFSIAPLSVAQTRWQTLGDVSSFEKRTDGIEIQAQHGRCPLCRGLLLHADREPQTPDEWEQWVKVTRTAIRRQAITADAGHGTSNETAALRLIHAHCARPLNSGHAQGPGTSACL